MTVNPTTRQPDPGRYALRLADGRYFNTLTHRAIPEGEMWQQGMLSGQERGAVIDRLMKLTPCYVTLIPSFECNLRCPHCYVGDRLQRPSGTRFGDTDPDLVIDFMRRIKAHPGWGLDRCAIVGGEPLLHPDLMRRVLDSDICLCSTTTNGIWDFDQVKDVLGHRNLFLITFSIDGLPEHHNRVRRALNHEPDTFSITYRNLARTARSWPDKIVHVQGSTVGRDYTPQERERYQALMLLAGVKPTNIKIGVEAPVRDRPSPNFMKIIGTALRGGPCCDYLLGKQAVITGGMIYATYYTAGLQQPLGSLTDPLDKILDNYRQHILVNSPLLNDRTCMEECRAVGVCWGHCSNAEPAYTGGKPSTICNRAYKEARVVQVAELEAAGRRVPQSAEELALLGMNNLGGHAT